MVLQLPPSKISSLYFGVGNIEGLLEHWQWIFLGGDPARTVKYHGFATTPPQKFHRRCIFLCVIMCIIYIYIYECMKV